jgi:2-polyprenyl-3-methyl-5-hydroxy-6-metoxy-1,4-benzoquinol methylase
MKPLRVRYQTIEFDTVDIHLKTLRDNQQFNDPFGEAEAFGISSAQWPLFGIVWPSSEILAHEMEHFPIEGKRILEVGCGIALTSLLLNTRHADITATDIHPEVGIFLAENVRLNNAAKIPFLRTDWKDFNKGLGKFDIIIGSDILYEREHIELLSQFIIQHTASTCEVILVDPGRNNHAAFSKKMVKLGFSHTQHASKYSELISSDFKGQVLHYLRS